MNHFRESAEALMKEMVAEYRGYPELREKDRRLERVNITKLRTYFELMVRAQHLDKLSAEKAEEMMDAAITAFKSAAHPSNPGFDESNFKGVYHCLEGDQRRHIRNGIPRETLCGMQISKVNNRGVDMSFPVCPFCVEEY